MPKWKNPATGETVEMPSDGLREFYESRGWVDVGSFTSTEPDPDNDDLPASMGGLLASFADEPKGKKK